MIKSPATDFEIQMHKELKDKVVVDSRYEFLRSHKGIRPNCLHGLMGTMGCGKSTLAKCIIAETALQMKVLVWLSEESVVEYQELINHLDKSCLKNILFVEEGDIPDSIKDSQNDFFEYFEQAVDDAGADIVFIDNVTSSAFYNQRYGFLGQNKTAEFLISFVKRKCSVFYVIHSGSKITDNHGRTISPEENRGSTELPLVTEYFYIIQKLTSNDRQYNLLRNSKYRHHDEASGWYSLKYEKKAYVGDKWVPFTLVNTLFNSRDYLGRKDKKAKK